MDTGQQSNQVDEKLGQIHYLFSKSGLYFTEISRMQALNLMKHHIK